MVRLEEVPRTATFAWSPDVSTPAIATGTRAGAVNADFSNDTQLEIWSLSHETRDEESELQPITNVATDSRFYDIAWERPQSSSGAGIIAGALESGSLDLWDADKLLNKHDEAIIARASKHSDAIKALQFNPFRPELLATAGAKGELFISDLNNLENPFRLGNTAARADDFECLDWNKKVPHIMVTGSSSGFVTVWDVKSKKESLTLNNYGRKPVGAVAWDPEKPTRLITAVPLDTEPVILVWDLRNSNAPEKILRGHEGGVLSLSWCQQDNDLLLSCGMDNRTICWNPQTGESYGEFPVARNWTFQTRWNPRCPGVLATASFDGKIAVQTIQNTKSDVSKTTGSNLLDGEDFFNVAQTQPQNSSFSLTKAPQWFERPCGVSFGFGGKLVTFNTPSSVSGGSRKSKVTISTFAVDPEIGKLTDTFSNYMKERNFKSLCETRMDEAQTASEKADWRILKMLTGKDSRKELVNFLGFSGSGEVGDTDMGNAGEQMQTTSSLAASATNGNEPPKTNRLSAFFENGEDSDSFLADLASTKGAKTNSPFHIYSDDEPEADKRITQALVLGHFDRAMDLCLQEGRLSDAFMIATCGGQTSIEKVQKAYFKKQSAGPKYLRLLASVVGKNLWDIVYNADLGNWKEIMATLCTFADAEDFQDLCEALGDRLDEQSLQDSRDLERRQDTAFCYIAGSKLEKVVGVWITELGHIEREMLKSFDNGTSFSIHARALQDFIEKVTVFREVTKYQDRDLFATENWKLAPLYEKYIEYADIVASHGYLQVAEQYLALLPEKYPAAEVARSRIKRATEQATSQKQQKQPRNAASVPYNAQPSFQTFEEPRGFAVDRRPGQYLPPNPMQASNQFSGQAPTPYGVPAAPQQIQPSTSRQVIPPPPSAFVPPNQGAPRNNTASLATHPPSKASNMPNWNDTPEDFFKPPTSRRGTPLVQPPPVAAPFAAQPGVTGGPPIGSQTTGTLSARATPPVPPPPPKGPAPPRTITPQLDQVYQQPERPSSSAANAYAPPTSSAQTSQLLGQVPRGPSPYNAPPNAPPRDLGSRYAPAPAVQDPMLTSQSQRPPPPPNPFASRQSFTQQQESKSNPNTPSTELLSSSNPTGTSQGPPPKGVSPQRQAPKPQSPRHPPGDRSHISALAHPIFECLSEDMQRVKARAPATFKAHVNDTEKRLNLLFDHLNNDTLLKEKTVRDMVELAQAVKAKDYDKAQAIHVDILTNRMDECGNWMTGVKRLISMSRATP